MEKDSSEIHADDAKANLEKNRKRTVKTRAQVEALEKFYNEHKYPTEEMKLKLSESIGLTEKQVSGWFCHRRLKDKKLTNGENYVSERQDNKPNGVVRDHGGGHGQDSCGSTKQGDERNLDTREIESGRLAPKELLAADLTNALPDSHYAKNCNHVGDPSLGSTSSLLNMPMPFHQNVNHMDIANANYIVPITAGLKNLKSRRGPSGYLKVMGRVENAAVIAVKRQLGKHYREDSPLLGVEFDPLPPRAFESVTKDLVEETYNAGEGAFPTSADVTKIHEEPPLFGQRDEHNSTLASTNNDEPSFKIRHGQGTPNGYIDKKIRPRTALSSWVACYPGSNSSIQFPEAPDKCLPGSYSRDEYGLKTRPGAEVMRVNSISTHPQLQTYSGKVRGQSRKYDDAGREVFRENTQNENSTLAMKRKEYPRQTFKNGNMYPEWRVHGENRVKIPFNRDLNTTKRMREEFPPHQHLKRSSVMDKLQQTKQVVRSATETLLSCSEDEESS